MLEIHEQLTSDDARQARQYLRRVIGFLLLAAVTIGTVIWATRAHAADPHKVNEQGCAYIADVAITARALSEAGVDRELAEKILRSMYTAANPFVQKIRVRVTEAAFQSNVSPTDYSQKMFESCVGADGVLDKFLGIAI